MIYRASLVKGDWGASPHYPKFPRVPPHCFDPKIPILYFSCSFWPFCPNCPLHQSTPLGKP